MSRKFIYEAGDVNFTSQEFVPPKKEESFLQMLNVITCAIGSAPRFAGDESQEDMVAAEELYKKRKSAALKKYSNLVKGLRELQDEHPALSKRFADRLKELK